MRLLVYMRDGRTVYQIVGRGVLRKLVNDEPWNEQPGVDVQRGIWNPTTGMYVWAGIRIRFIAKASISVVEEAAHGEAVPAP